MGDEGMDGWMGVRGVGFGACVGGLSVDRFDQGRCLVATDWNEWVGNLLNFYGGLGNLPYPTAKALIL